MQAKHLDPFAEKIAPEHVGAIRVCGSILGKLWVRFGSVRFANGSSTVRFYMVPKPRFVSIYRLTAKTWFLVPKTSKNQVFWR